jgi:MEDS: MEthanogen/methylotroph, DcmR Sensory domain
MDHATKSARTSGQFHAVRFYENQESLCRIVAEFLGEGFVGGQPAIVIATPAHCDGIVAELRTRHFDVDNLLRAGDLLLLDAQETLDRFMVDGLPSTDLFKAVGTTAIERVRRSRSECVLRAYGEMVDLLWKEGRTIAAVRLEMLWNQLAMTHDFSLLCGYSMGNFYKDAGVGDICRQHSHVLSADGEAAPVN